MEMTCCRAQCFAVALGLSTSDCNLLPREHSSRKRARSGSVGAFFFFLDFLSIFQLWNVNYQVPKERASLFEMGSKVDFKQCCLGQNLLS